VGVVGPKRWVKLLEYGFRFFFIFSVIFVLFNKYGNRYVVRIDQNTIGLSYRPFLDWVKKSSNFSDFCTVHLNFFALFIWAGSAIFFLLIQRVFKYLNNLNLQNKKSVLT
jgi:hypothetical protein